MLLGASAWETIHAVSSMHSSHGITIGFLYLSTGMDTPSKRERDYLQLMRRLDNIVSRGRASSSDSDLDSDDRDAFYVRTTRYQVMNLYVLLHGSHNFIMLFDAILACICFRSPVGYRCGH